MTYRIVDRIVIWTGTAASVFVLCGGHPGAADIAVILVSFILGIACELKRNELIAALSAAAVFISSFFLPGMALVMPTAVYSLVICSRKLAQSVSIALRCAAGGAMALAVVLTERIRPDLMTCFEFVSAGRYPYTGSFGMLTSHDREVVNKALEKVNALDIADKDISRPAKKRGETGKQGFPSLPAAVSVRQQRRA